MIKFDLNNKAEISYRVTLVLFFVIVFQMIFRGIFHEFNSAKLAWIVSVIPFVLFLPGMLKYNYRTYSWLCFTLLLYFIVATEHIFLSDANFVDYLYFTSIVLLFISSMFTSRWLQRAQKQADLGS